MDVIAMVSKLRTKFIAQMLVWLGLLTRLCLIACGDGYNPYFEIHVGDGLRMQQIAMVSKLKTVITAKMPKSG
jgi:hypothetical protein